MSASRRELLVSVSLLVGAAWGISETRPRAVAKYEAAHALSEVYVLPDPTQLTVLSLGYRSALADLIFGQTLVTAGMHFSEKQVFENVDAYLEAIVALEPRYRDVYYYADSLLTLSSVRMPARNYRIAREFQERGLALFPDDAQLWISAGQFVTYLAVQWLPEGEDPDEWRRAGVRIIEHACDIWPYPDLPVSCLGASSVLSRLGETEAAIASLHRLAAVTDDPKVRAEATHRLEALLSEHAREQLRARLSRLEALQLRDLPHVSRTQYQLIGPPTDAAQCSGIRLPEQHPACASSFSQFAAPRPPAASGS